MPSRRAHDPQAQPAAQREGRPPRVAGHRVLSEDLARRRLATAAPLRDVLVIGTVVILFSTPTSVVA